MSKNNIKSLLKFYKPNGYDSIVLNNAQKKLNKIFLNMKCEWFDKIGNIKNQFVNDIKVVFITENNKTNNKINVYFNDTAVDIEQDVVIHDIELVGIPSGEIIFLSDEKIEQLLKLGLIFFEKHFTFNGKYYSNIHFFKDSNYHNIQRYIHNEKRIYIHDDDDDLDEYEINDDYHIKRLFQKNENLKIGDVVVLTNTKSALYMTDLKEFVNVWFPVGHNLGKIIEMMKFMGVECVKTDNSNAIYKKDCVKKLHFK